MDSNLKRIRRPDVTSTCLPVARLTEDFRSLYSATGNLEPGSCYNVGELSEHDARRPDTPHTALESGDAEGARGMLSATLSMVDRTAKHGALESNAADRTKSRLTKALNRSAS